jgi:hypothetical protein
MSASIVLPRRDVRRKTGRDKGLHYAYCFLKFQLVANLYSTAESIVYKSVFTRSGHPGPQKTHADLNSRYPKERPYTFVMGPQRGPDLTHVR